MSAIGCLSQEELARAKVCSLDPKSSRSSQGLRPYKNLKECIPRSSQGTSRNHEKYTPRSSQQIFARASLRIRISQGVCFLPNLELLVVLYKYLVFSQN